MFLRNAWYSLGWSDELVAGQIKPYLIIDEPLVAMRRADGSVAVLEDRCAHRAAPLSLGRLEADGSIRCMYHGVRFDSRTGQGVEVPGQPRVPEQMRIRTYPVIEVEGWMFVWMGDADKADPALMPAVAGPLSTQWSVVRGQMDYDVDYQLINDNLCDFSHLAFVHVQTFGAGDPDYFRSWAEEKSDITTIARGIHLDRWVQGEKATPGLADKAPEGLVDRHITYDYLAPGVLLMRQEVFPYGTRRATGGDTTGIEPLYADYNSQCVVPVSERKSRYLFAWGPRPQDVQPGMLEGIEQVAYAAFTEDRTMIEAQQRILDKLPGRAFQPIVHDRGPNQMRWVMDKLFKAEQAQQG